jgi:hypothetical protein
MYEEFPRPVIIVTLKVDLRVWKSGPPRMEICLKGWTSAYFHMDLRVCLNRKQEDA